MFIDIDYRKRPRDAKFHLAKPNKQIIDIIPERLNHSVNLKLGEVNELEFSVPYRIEDDNGNLVRNNHVDTIKERMLIRLTLNTYKEWFVVDNIEEEGSDSDLFMVKCFSLGYELRGHQSPEFDEESDVVNATSALNKVLERTAWNIGEIDDVFNNMSRSLDIGEDTNVLDAIMQIVETFGALIVWDTENRKISLKNMQDNGKFRGMTINYGKLLNSIKRTRTTDEMVTRLYIEGSEGLTVNSVNPTGQGYIEDFSYFMYPFERDENGNVLKSSYFMSDELCHAILNQNGAINKYSPQIMDLQKALIEHQGELMVKQSELDVLEMEMEVILELLDMAKASESEEFIERRSRERDEKQVETDEVIRIVDKLELDIIAITNEMETLREKVDEETGFTPELYEELKLYTIEKTWRDDRYIDVQELFDDGVKEFEKLRQPKVVLDVSIDNLLNIVEEQYYWDKLIIGDMIKIKYPQMDIEYMATIIEINYDLENNEAEIVVANTKELLDDNEKLIQLLYSNSSASTLIENNKYKWDKINAVENEVNQIISQEWDANKKKITAGVNNDIEIGRRGIIIRNPDFPNEVVIMQSGIIALSEDNGDTWKTAIKPTGIVAERLIGKIIAGQELIITNSKGSFTMDRNGFRVRGVDFVVENSSGDKNLVDEWNKTGDFVEDFRDDNIITSYEKEQLQERWTEIRIKYDFIVEVLNNYYNDDLGNHEPQIAFLHETYQRLFRYLFVEEQTDGYPLLSEESMNKSTRIDRNLFQSRFDDYRNQVPVVEEFIHRKTNEFIKQAQEDAEEARRQIEEIENDTVWKLELTSSQGLIFTNRNIDTVITATVYKGSENYTEKIPKEGFIWKKHDKDGNLDVSWTNRHSGIGNVINISEEDVFKKAVFSCDIDV